MRTVPQPAIAPLNRGALKFRTEARQKEVHQSGGRGSCYITVPSAGWGVEREFLPVIELFPTDPDICRIESLSIPSEHSMVAASGERKDDELARAAARVYEAKVRPVVGPQDAHRFVAIDVKSGSFEIDDDDYTVISKLLSRVPDADGFLMRADGSPAYKMRRTW
jgi:hypothetical protein